MKWLEFSDYVEVIMPTIGVDILFCLVDNNILYSFIIILISILIDFLALKFRNYQYKKEIEREAKRDAEIERLKNNF